MKTKISLNDVKEYFKNAKEVKDFLSIAVIDLETIRYDRLNKKVILCDSDCYETGLTELYNNGYAEIISYKKAKKAKNEKMKFLEWLDKVGNVHRFNPEAIELALSKFD